MSASVTILVLLAALLHALWNALVKAGDDRLLMVTWISVGASCLMLPLALLALFYYPPLPTIAWPFLILSLGIHTGYKLFLARAYGHGDFGQIYPLARGAAPLLVTVAGFFLLNERLDAASLAGIGLLALAVMSLLRRPAAAHDSRGVLYALATAVFIAAYTVNDGHAARISAAPHIYAVWLLGLDGVVMVTLTTMMRGRRAVWEARRLWRTGLPGGVMSAVAFWIVIWAMTVAPLGPVAALRESSVVIAALISAFILREGDVLRRFIAAGLVVAGVACLQL